jgi:N-acetyl-gamma-glutamyl-phosphate reductase
MSDSRINLQNEAASRGGAPRVAVVGARGYSGLELCRLLLKHPLAKLSGCFATDDRFVLSSYLSETAARAVPTWQIEQTGEKFSELDIVFLATPADVSLKLAPQILKAGVDVIDLSGAFRLRAGTKMNRLESYRKWYGLEHDQPELLENADYGLVPFAGRAKEGRGRLVANPGCYATAVSMALIPLFRAGLIDQDSIVIDAKSGTTGGGRKAAESLLFTEVEGECLPYKVTKHQHLPEIMEAASLFASTEFAPFFTTHLLNVRRGIIASIYAKIPKEKISRDAKETEAKIANAFQEAYSHYSLVSYGALGSTSHDSLLSLKRVVGSPRTQISFKVDGEKLYLFSVIDNLVKGAASQAIENFNRLSNEPVDLGLTDVEGVL